MKKILTLVIVAILIILVILFFRSCQEEDPLEQDAVFPPHKKGEMIVVYKNAPTPETTQRIRDEIGAQIDISGLNIRQCSDCDNFVELWQAENIHTLIHNQGITSGTGKTKPVGEDDDAIYSVNYISALPMDFSPVNEKYIREHAQDSALLIPEIQSSGKDTIVIAVLDTGIDTIHFNNTPYLWTNNNETACYPGNRKGWNFTNNSADIVDGNPGKHGTLVSHYIINEFKNTPQNFIQIMSLKTHDNDGNGDLFSNICAIHFAINNNAHIINASWGFYNFDNNAHPYMDDLIGNVLKEKGILFVAAAGNQLDEADSVTKITYKNKYGTELPDDSLRSIGINHFYPANISFNENNSVISVTTTFDDKTSPTQNFSSGYVDLGVKADNVSPTHMQFKLPFPSNVDFTSGSSFAAAIASGKIGAFLPISEFKPGINKQDVFNELSGIHATLGVSQFLFEDSGLIGNKLVRNGRYIIRL